MGWWTELLMARARGEAFFPRTIRRVGKVKGTDILKNHASIQNSLIELRAQAKPGKLQSYRIDWKSYHFQKAGDHLLPDSIEFESLQDYLSFLGKQKEWAAFDAHLALIVKTIPALKQWILQNVLQLTDLSTPWVDILQVCLYFIKNPRPGLYIRQLPIEVHTKFVEQHTTVLCSLLDFLLPQDIRNPKERRIDRRYYLRFDESLIRMRMLDPRLNLIRFCSTVSEALTTQPTPHTADISLPVSDFNNLALTIKNVFIAENKMNFLTLPPLPDSVAIWSGGGFQVSCLRDASWLDKSRIIYWGDIDEHGFQILNQIRHYFPRTESVMMDRRTLSYFEKYRGRGAKNSAELLSLLTEEEQLTYALIKASELNRLEQEKIDQEYVNRMLTDLVV